MNRLKNFYPLIKDIPIALMFRRVALPNGDKIFFRETEQFFEFRSTRFVYYRTHFLYWNKEVNLYAYALLETMKVLGLENRLKN